MLCEYRNRLKYYIYSPQTRKYTSTRLLAIINNMYNLFLLCMCIQLAHAFVSVHLAVVGLWPPYTNSVLEGLWNTME